MSDRSKKKGVVKKVLLVIGALLVIVQFVFRIDKSVPEFDKSQDLIALTCPTEDVEYLLKTACYDCHSYETEYPWYSNVVPFSVWIGHHIEEGREHLNFSVWGTYPAEKAAHKLEECAEETEEKEMPLDSYTWTHGDAKLSAEEIELLEDWFKSEQLKIAE